MRCYLPLISGGSLAKFLCAGLPKANTDWSKWRVYFCDERHVGFDDPENTYSIYKTGLFSKVSLPSENVFPDNPDISGGWNHCGLVVPYDNIKLGQHWITSMACCLMAPNHYLHLCWLIISKVLLHSPEGISQVMHKIPIPDMNLKIIN